MRKFLLLICLVGSVEANAGFNGLTWHSRANCAGFNESITWDARWYRTYATVSDHFYGRNVHEINPGFEDSWRSAAYHYAEGYGGWKVIGSHWMVHEQTGRTFMLGQETVVDCSIYDGWWDRGGPTSYSNKGQK